MASMASSEALDTSMFTLAAKNSFPYCVDDRVSLLSRGMRYEQRALTHSSQELNATVGDVLADGSRISENLHSDGL